VIEQMAVAVIVTDLAGTIIGWNRQAALLYGWPAEEAMGRQIMDVLVDDNDRDRAEDILGGVRLGETWGGEFPVRRKDGARVVAFVTNSPLLDADGSPIGVIGVSVGITERRQAEQDRSELLAREREARTRAEEANSELQILQEVIEIALAHVAVDDLVLALLTRIRDTLNVDTATLLLFNDEQTHLVVRATLGREGEEVEALRIPRGEGLAGRIAQGGAPLVVDDLTQVEVHSDFLRKNIRSLLGVPLFVENRVIGVVHVGTRNPHAFSRHEVQVLKAVADRAALAIDHVRLYEAERAARAELEATQRRLQFLLDGSTLLSFSLDFPQALRQAARLAVGALADLCLIDVIDEQGKVRRMAAQHRDPAQEPKMRELRGRFAPDPDGPHPAVHVMKTGRSEFAPDMPDEFLRRTTRDEEHYRLVKELGFQSYMCVALTARGRTLGTITLVSTDPERRFGQAEVELAEDLARRAALAVDNARLYEAEARARARAEDAGERLAFLAEASNVLSSSLDYRKTLARVARLAVPRLADWCTVDMVEDDGSIRSLAVAHVDPAKVDMALELRERYPTDPDAPYGVPNVIRTGQPELIPEIHDSLIEETTQDPGLIRIAKELQLRSIMTVPLRARGRNIGAISFIGAESGRTYGPEDLSLATDLARRAAMAIDNARLFQDRSYIARTLQQSLLPPALPDIPGIEVAARYRAAGEGNEVGGDFYDVFDTGDGAWAAVIGDVCGKGAGAAAVMGVARHTVRAAAMQERRPSRILATLNDGLLRQTSEGRFLTVCYVRLWPDPGRARLTVCSGGHPLPLVLRANGSVETAGRPGTLLGVFPDPQLHDVQVDLEAGETIVMFTDGVTEEHGKDPGDIFGDERLSQVLQGSAGETAEGIVQRIDEAVRSFQPNELRDDLAVLALRVSP
jgi:PAS domain S-box-containing protein